VSLKYDQILSGRATGRLQIIPEQLLVVAYQDDPAAEAIRLDLLEELAAKDETVSKLSARLDALETALSRLIRAQTRR
jgi:hypothetical protein